MWRFCEDGTKKPARSFIKRVECEDYMKKSLRLDRNTLPKSNMIFDFWSGIFWFWVVPSCIFVFFTLNFQRIITRGSLPRAHRLMWSFFEEQQWHTLFLELGTTKSRRFLLGRKGISVNSAELLAPNLYVWKNDRPFPKSNRLPEPIVILMHRAPSTGDKTFWLPGQPQQLPRDSFP